MPHILFLDESGHAGINYLDADQPFHVVAGVLVDDDKLAAFRRGMSGSLTRAQGEVKGSQLMRSGRGQQRAIDVLSAVGRNAGVPFFVMMERRFALLLKLVEVFLDTAHQDAVDWLPNGDFSGRREVTEVLAARVPQAVVDKFATEYRAPTLAGFEAVLKGVIEALDDGQLRTSFQGALRALTTIVDAETYGDETSRHGDWAALNVPAFCHTVRLVDRFMDLHDDTFRIVHDQTAQFEPLLRNSVSALSQPGTERPDLRLPNGDVVRLALQNCTGFEIGDSKSEIGIRAADVLAASVSKVAKSILSETPWTQELRGLAQKILPALLIEHPFGGQLSAAIFASKGTNRMVVARLFDNIAPRVSSRVRKN